jgi:hypothetical protein
MANLRSLMHVERRPTKSKISGPHDGDVRMALDKAQRRKTVFRGRRMISLVGDVITSVLFDPTTYVPAAIAYASLRDWNTSQPQFRNVFLELNRFTVTTEHCFAPERDRADFVRVLVGLHCVSQSLSTGCRERAVGSAVRVSVRTTGSQCRQERKWRLGTEVARQDCMAAS